MRLLHSVGVGEIDPKKIEVRGLPLKEAVCPFNPKHEPLEIPTAYHGLRRSAAEGVGARVKINWVVLSTGVARP